MKKIDLLRLRKAAGLSQKELAEKLAVRPSFLSAIENGRSRFPEDKIGRLLQIMELDNIDDYLTDETADPVVPPHSHAVEETDAITSLLKHIHAQAHKADMGTKARETELEERISFLIKRNDRLSERVDTLREQVDALREDNFRLKELLTRHKISY